MAIALDKTSFTVGASTVASPFTRTLSALVTAGGSDRLMMVALTAQASTGGTAPTLTVTCGGASMTQVTSATVTNGAVRSSLYFLLAPVAGSNAVVVTCNIKSFLSIIASSWTGVLQSGTFNTANTASGSPTAVTVTALTASGEVLVDAASTINGSTDTVGANQTTLALTGLGASSYQAGADGGVMSWTLSQTFTWTTAAVSFKPATAPGPIIVPPPVADGGTQATAAATVAEMRLAPLRAAPTGFSTQTGTAATIENNAAAWEASGLFNEIIMGTKDGPDFIWDTIYTPPSSAPGGVIRVCAMPTTNSPNGSLLFTSQDMMVAYPLPFTIDPVLTAYPRVAASSANASATSDLVPIFYPSAIDMGNGQYQVVAAQCIGENFAYEVDSWAFTYRWDETNPWETVQRLKQPNALFLIPGANQGRTLHLAFNINDASNLDPIGAQGAHIILWMVPRAGRSDLPKQRDRQSAPTGSSEVS